MKPTKHPRALCGQEGSRVTICNVKMMACNSCLVDQFRIAEIKRRIADGRIK